MDITGGMVEDEEFGHIPRVISYGGWGILAKLTPQDPYYSWALGGHIQK